MKEAKNIVSEYNKINFKEAKAALATVVQVKGSSYRRPGARMLILDTGEYFGGISGGCLEKDVLRKAKNAILQNRSCLLVYDTTQDDEFQVGISLGCNGVIEVLITPLDPNDGHNPVQLLSNVLTQNETGIIVSIIGDDKSDLFGRSFIYKNHEQFIEDFEIKQITSFVLHDIKSCIEDKASKTITYSYANKTTTIFIEVILPTTQLIIYGSNYDVCPLTRLAIELGWNVAIIANITKNTLSLFSTSVNVILQDNGNHPAIDENTAIVLMSHDYRTDLDNFQKVFDSKAFYIGLLGPKKRSRKIFEFILAKNNGPHKLNLDHIFAPAGLDIGALTPEEIALSILAEIKSCFAGRTGTPLRLRPNTIHSDEIINYG